MWVSPGTAYVPCYRPSPAVARFMIVVYTGPNHVQACRVGGDDLTSFVTYGAGSSFLAALGFQVAAPTARTESDDATMSGQFAGVARNSCSAAGVTPGIVARVRSWSVAESGTRPTSTAARRRMAPNCSGSDLKLSD